ncbi:MAG: 50S ribosomal protein L11 methyltransferase [OM182 bacterium MED-G24]|uniref:Ribosomal protein L11 methyltransferase n=1 Tax=OM182 bacterium MED-G24 TaxID=1986255 RepID=A0A2A5WZY5_9GAMM|nr:MAG: 50S ribosomal protein L11 methyltransferase [OM182 bacterium MED-G24]RPG27527.1 MAG: 50S ribosomal protein L11 methyltransferase [Gammaproteobacteria bacterium TMED50]
MTVSKAEAEEVEQCCWDLGAVSVTMMDDSGVDLLEPAPGETPLWESVSLSGLFEEDVDVQTVELKLRALGLQVHADTILDQDWERAWLARFRPMRFGERLWICPTGFRVDEPGAVVVDLDPGLAFGTGTHATTAMCLEWLDASIQGGEKLLDYGCGSGILTIAAVKLGAGTTTAIDNDPQAVTAARINAARNDIEQSVEVLDSKQRVTSDFDVVVANILAEPLVTLSRKVSGALKSGGLLVLSGIVESQVAWVSDAYTNVRFDEPLVRDGWVRLTGQKQK